MLMRKEKLPIRVECCLKDNDLFEWKLVVAQNIWKNWERKNETKLEKENNQRIYGKYFQAWLETKTPINRIKQKSPTCNRNRKCLSSQSIALKHRTN